MRRASRTEVGCVGFAEAGRHLSEQTLLPLADREVAATTEGRGRGGRGTDRVDPNPDAREARETPGAPRDEAREVRSYRSPRSRAHDHAVASLKLCHETRQEVICGVEPRVPRPSRPGGLRQF